MGLLKQVFQEGSDTNFPDDYYPTVDALKQAVAGNPRYDYTFAGLWTEPEPFATPSFQTAWERELVGVAF